MSHRDTASIYSPETAGTEAASQALVLRQREHQQVIEQWHVKRRQEQEAIDALRRQTEKQMEVVRQERANNWAERDRITSARRNLEHENSVLIRDKEAVRKKDEQLQELENRRRRNRTPSLAYIEDTFPNLSPRDVVGLLTASSTRLRDHAMHNLSTCVNGSSEVTPPLVPLKAQDIAPFILPKLHQLLSAPNQPIESVSKFCKDLVSSPPMAKALATSGECSRLADYLIEPNERISTLAICSLRQMISMEAAVVKAAYRSLATVIPQLPIPSSPQEPYHPAVNFVEEMAPKIIEDCFNNSLWDAISPLVDHKITCIRQVVLSKIALEAQLSDRTQHGIVEAHTLGLLDHHFESSSPSPEVVDCFVRILPSIATKLCRNHNRVLWLLRRLSDPSPHINGAVTQALQASAMKHDSTIHDIFVKAEVLRHLHDLPTQSSFGTTRFICDLLPVLALAHARKNKCFAIIRFIDHPEADVSHSCLLACTKIVDSTVENRANLYTVVEKLNFAKESSLKLCEIAMPAFCRDWAAEGAFTQIAKLLTHQERCVRLAANRVWLEVVSNTPSARAKIINDNLLGIFFDLCNSPNDDSIKLGCQTLPFMALEISRAGVGPSRQLVGYLSHSLPELRQSTLQSIRIIAEGSESDRSVLLEAGAFSAIILAFQTNPQEATEIAHRFLISMVPAVSTSSDACWSLLQLLESPVPHVENAARSALGAISKTNIEYRETLRKVILKRLVLASDVFIDYSVRAIQEWIGADLAKLNDFVTFFDLVSHADRRIQNGALFSLRERLDDRGYQESFEKANIVFLMRTLAGTDNPEAINFVAFALPSLALTLARNGHVSDILQFLTYNEPKIREGASGAIEAIASSSNLDKGHLMAEDVLERLVGGNERLGQTELHLCTTVIPKLAVDYLHANKLNLIFALVDHAQQLIRLAAARALSAIVGGTEDERAVLREQLLPRLDTASPALRVVASDALSRALARDLVLKGDYTPLFRLLDNEDPRIRAPVIAELRRHIQGSDEAVRKRLVDADILPCVVHALRQPKDDLISFTADQVLPILGPSFSQSDGAIGVIPLLSHAEPQIRTAATTALRNAVDSQYGCIQKMVATAVVSQLHSLIDSYDAVRELWCYLLPQTAPYLSNQAEIETVLDCLGDSRPTVQEAASETIHTMAKTSDETRLNLFPAMVHRLDAPSLDDTTTMHLAEAISLSGFAFITNGQETKLLRLIQNNKPAFAIAAVKAVNDLLNKGRLYEHQKLLNGGIFTIAFNLHAEPQHRELGLDLLHSVIPPLSHGIILKAGDAEKLFSLFDDPDTDLVQGLYQTLVDDSRVFASAALLDLIPILLEKGGNPKVSGLLCHLAPSIVPRLMSLRRVNVIMKLLMAGGDGSVARSYLQAIHNNAMDATTDEKDLLADNSVFVPVLGDYLNSNNATLRRISSEIIQILAGGSEWRAGRMMEEGIGQSLARVAVQGETAAQRPSIDALKSLLLAAPDHADRLVRECLPALHDILADVHRSSDVYASALSLLGEITNTAAYSSSIIGSGIIEIVVQWLSPQHTNQNSDCRQYIFQISQKISQHSDPGRKTLIDSGVLPILIQLINDSVATNVIHGCKILGALAQTGTYWEDLDVAGVKDGLERITSPFRQSKLKTKADKEVARVQAKQVLLTLKSVKDSAIRGTKTASDASPLQLAQASRLPSRQLSSFRPSSMWRNEDAPGAGQLGRVTSDELGRLDLGSSAEGNGAMNEVRHARFSSAPAGVPTSLSAVPEERTRPPVANEVLSASEATDTDALEHQSRSYEVDATRRGLEFSSYQGRASHFRGGSFDSGSLRRPPPSYRTMPGPGSLVAASNGSDPLSPSNSLRSSSRNSYVVKF